MKALMRARCTECGGSLKKTAITQEFENEGVKVRVSGMRAWVCSRCGEIYFQPGPKGWPTRSNLCLRWPDQKSNTKVLSLPISPELSEAYVSGLRIDRLRGVRSANPTLGRFATASQT